MKVLICLSVLSLMTLHYFNVSGQTSKKDDRSAEWEYKQLNSPSDEIINHHAKEGWEIATTAGGRNDNGFIFYVFMKRHKSHALFGTQISAYKKPEPPPPQISNCKMTLAQAPVIRGLRLGMTSDELFTFFPGNERQQFDRTEGLKRAEIRPHYGYTSFHFSPSEFSTTDRFKGISSFNIGLLDRKVVSIDADYYDTPEYDRIEQLLEVISRQFSLPEYKGWSGYQENMNFASLSCGGFTVYVNGYSSRFNIRLIHPTYNKVVEDRRQADRLKGREGFKL
jgi:hypothetical protein